MKTVNYILQVGPGRALGDTGRRGRPAMRDKVVELEAWKAEHLAEPGGPEPDDLPASVPERRGGRKPVRRGHWRLPDLAELAATLAVAAAFLALAARVLFV